MTGRDPRTRTHREDSRRSSTRSTDLARRVSEIFSGDRPAENTWRDLCSLLADVFEATRVTLAVRRDGDGSIAFVVQDRTSESAPHENHEKALDTMLSSKRAVHLGTLIGAPLLVGTETAGAIAVEGRQRYASWQATLLESCALFVAARLYQELAYTDALTRIANRRRFDDALGEEWKRAARAQQPLTLVMIDVDFFKVFNDTYGHQAGDRCLQSVARALRGCVSRPGDLIARYGGEEFVALLPSTPLSGGIVLAEAFRTAVAREAMPHAGSSLGTVSLSIGVASVAPGSGGDPQALIQHADAALYRAKEAGRNRVVAQEYESDAKAVQRAAQLRKTNMPAHGSPLIGRTAERAHLRELIAAHRLVSIVGVGGSGKTRIAVHIASEQLDDYEDGVWFVDFSSLTDAAHAAASIGTALSVPIAGDESGAEALVHALRRRSLLLVLDNCEHVADAVTPLLGLVLPHCPGVRILATSRSTLGVESEVVYRLPLLSPDDGAALFVERAKAVKPGFCKTPENQAAIAEVCALVDGIALCVELTAARVAVASVDQIAARLRENFRILTSGRRGALARHQTMRALIDWSHDLLSGAERRLFRRLAIFSGGWTLDAAAAVCADDDLDAFELFDLHAALLDKSIVADDVSTAQTRFRLLEPIREYAREQLEESVEFDDAARRHAAYFARRAQDADAAFYTTPSQAWFTGVQGDLANYRAALHWSISGGNDALTGAIAAGALSWYFYYLSPAEGVRWIRAALAALRERDEPAIEGRLHLALTPLYGLPPAEKREAGERAVALYRRVGDRLHLSHALRMLGLTLAWYFPSDRASADAYISEAGDIASQLGDAIATALVLQARSQVVDASNTATRKALKERAYELLREHGNDRQLAVVLTDLSEGAFTEGDNDAALRYGRDALRLAEQSGSRNTMLCAGINLMHYAAAVCDWDTARTTAARTLAWAEESRAGEFVTYALNGIACIADGLGAPDVAAQLFAFCDTRFGTLHAPRHDGMCEDVMHRRTMAHLQGVLDASGLSRALAHGAALSEERALALARDVLASTS